MYSDTNPYSDADPYADGDPYTVRDTYPDEHIHDDPDDDYDAYVQAQRDAERDAQAIRDLQPRYRAWAADINAHSGDRDGGDQHPGGDGS